MAIHRIRTMAVPEDGVWFELRVDNSIDPMRVVTSAGHDPTGWKYRGPKLDGMATYRAKLVPLGYVHDLAEASDRIGKMGCRPVEGQARDAFLTKFPRPNLGLVVFGGSQWERPNGRASVAYLDGFKNEWYTLFGWSDSAFGILFRWLVVER